VLKEVLSEERKGREDRKGRKAKISLRTLRSLRSTCVFVLAWFVVAQAQRTERAPYTSWPDYGGSPDSMQYSALTQIDKTNVGRREQTWFLPVPDRKGNFGFNPIVANGVMYALGPANAIVALDAASGDVIWSHAVEGTGPGNRGMNYWESADRSDRRLIFGAGGFLHEIDARTGETIRTFGTDGRVNMREGPFRPLGGPSGTAGRVFENLFLTGSTTGEGYGSPPGDLRAFDVITGKLVWTFHTIPHPGEFGHDTWPKDAWEWAGGANTWGEISVDEKRGIAYFPIGSATHDSFGGDRKGANLFANCLLALDARTGKRLWHFQAVHHDIWDYDLTTAPKLLTVRDPSQPGKMIDVVAQATKIGFLMAVSSWSSARRVWAARLGKTSGTSGTSRSSPASRPRRGTTRSPCRGISPRCTSPGAELRSHCPSTRTRTPSGLIRNSGRARDQITG